MSTPIEKGRIVGDGNDVIFHSAKGVHLYGFKSFPIGGTIDYWNDGYITYLTVQTPTEYYELSLDISSLKNITIERKDILPPDEELEVIVI